MVSTDAATIAANSSLSGTAPQVLHISMFHQGHPKPTPATENASQKSSGKDKNKEVRGDKI